MGLDPTSAVFLVDLQQINNREISDPPLIWFLLVDFATGQPYKGATATSILRSSLVVPVIDQFRDAVKAKYTNALSTVDSGTLLVYKNKSAFEKRNAAVDEEKEAPLAGNSSLDGLGKSMEEAIIVAVSDPHSFEAKFPPIDSGDLNGVNPKGNVFHRDLLLNRLKTFLASTEVWFVMSSSSASGKTSLLNMLKYDIESNSGNLYYVQYISCIPDLKKTFSFAGLNFDNAKYTPPVECGNRRHIIIIDDAQRSYGDNSWSNLIKHYWWSFDDKCKVIISSTHTLNPGRLSPAELQLISFQMRRSDMMLTYEESLSFLNDSKLGLDPQLMTFNELKSAIATDCNGLIGALKIVVRCFSDEIAAKQSFKTQDQALKFYFRQKVTSCMSRCYGSGHSGPVSDRHMQFLAKLFQSTTLLDDLNLNKDEKSALLDLIKSGILQRDESSGNISFASNMARRYYFGVLYPSRSPINPGSVRDLVLQCIPLLPAHMLKNATHVDGFPNEATFQQLFLSAMAQCTTQATQIMPELSTTFNHEKIPGRIDFYVNGPLCWGVELLVRGSHLQRFDGDDGIYRLLKCSQFVVVDFVVNSTGIDNQFKRHPNLITVIFKENDYKECLVLVSDERPLKIAL